VFSSLRWWKGYYQRESVALLRRYPRVIRLNFPDEDFRAGAALLRVGRYLKMARGKQLSARLLNAWRQGRSYFAERLFKTVYGHLSLADLPSKCTSAGKRYPVFGNLPTGISGPELFPGTRHPAAIAY